MKIGDPSKRLFVGNLPLLITASEIRRVLSVAQGGDGGSASASSCVTCIKWLTDAVTGAFYGSAFVKMTSLEAAGRVVAAGASEGGVRVKGTGACKRYRRLRIQFAPVGMHVMTR
jgi:hypothetical protein